MSRAIQNETPASAGVSFLLLAMVLAAPRENDEPRSELQWLRSELGRALLRPRDFARSLAAEHYGLAGVVVALVAGALLSVSIDWIVLASRGFDPLDHVGRLATNALLFSVRLAITAAVLSAIAAGIGIAASRLLRRPAAAAVESLFTALTFSLVPVLLVLPLVAVLALARAALPLVAIAAVALAIRFLVGLGLNLRAVLPLPLAVLAFAVVIAGASVGLGDQIVRVRSVTYAYAPGLAPALPAVAPTDQRFDGDSWSIAMPARWVNRTRGIAGEAARFETDTDTLVISRVSGSPLVTAEEYGDRVGTEQRRGMTDTRVERSVWRSGDLILVDERTRGRYEGRPILLRQFTGSSGSQVMALLFRYIEPSDERAALEETASIAAGWRISAER